MRRICSILPLFAFAGCAVRQPAAWRLSGVVLVPPGVANLSVSRTSVRACGRRQTIERAELERQPRGWLSNWAARCSEPTLSDRVLDSLPLESLTRIRLLRESDIRAGYLDLSPASRLEVISQTSAPKPLDIISIAGTDKVLNVDLKGPAPDAGITRQVTWYGFEPRLGGGSRIMLLSPAATNYYRFSQAVAYYRFFYMADQMSMVVGAPSFDQLPRDLEGCGKPGPFECIAVPPKVGVNVFTRVMVNGAPVVVVVPTVRSVIAAAKKRPEDVLPGLTIAKPYRGRQVAVKFDRSSSEILNLYLAGDEEIRW
jgi:hypothetical protein